MTEGTVVNACIRWLSLNGCWVWRNNTGAFKPEGRKSYVRFGAKGSPDILGLTRNGQFIGVECKYGDGKLKPEQKAFGEEITQRGGIYIVAYSVDDLVGKL